MSSSHTARRRKAWLFGLLALSAVLYLALPFLSSRAAVRRWLENVVSSASGYQAAIGAFRVNYDLSLTLQSLSIAQPGGSPFLKADRLRIGWVSSNLIRGRLGAIEVVGPRLFAGRLPRSNGEPSASSGEPRSDELSLPVGQISIQDGWVEYPVEERTAALGPFDLSIDSIRAGAGLELQGRSSIAGGGGDVDWSGWLGSDLNSLKGRMELRIDDARRIASTFAETQLPDLAAEMSASLTLRFDGSLGGQTEVDIEATVRHPELPEAASVVGDATIAVSSRTATLQLAVQVQPDVPAMDLNGRLDADAEGQPKIDASLRWESVAVDDLIRPLSLPWEIADGRLSLRAQAEGAVTNPAVTGFVEVVDVSIQAPAWKASGSVAAPFELDDGLVRSREPGIELTNWKGRAAAFDWQLEQSTIVGNVEPTGEETIASAESLVVAGLQFHDAEYLRAGEGLILRGPVEARLDDAGSLRLTVDVVASQGEILWDRFYMKLAAHPPRMEGTVDISSENVSFDALELSMSGIGAATIDGRYEWESGRPVVQAELDLPGLAPLFDVAVRDAFRETYPLLAETSLQGEAGATIDYREDATGTTLSGNLRLEDVAVSATEPSFQMSGLHLALPFELGDNLPSIEPRTGLLRIDELEIGAVQTTDVAISLTVRANQFTVDNAVRIPLLGGALFLADFDADRLAGPQPRARLSVQLQEIDLGQLSTALGGPSLRGTMTGAIPNVTVESGEIRSDGEIQADFFDGEARIRNLRFSQLLSPVPAFELDLAFDDISLGQLTETFEVGYVSGIVRGRVDGLEIVHRQPVRFDAWMETVPHPDVPQRVSVAAIRQLSILGGSGGDPLSSTILSFFDEYRYAKMGFRCSLRNDRFMLHGIEEIDGKDYLVVGSVMPPRVNVISHNQTISFSQMIRRLELALEKTEKEPAAETQTSQ